MATHEETPNGYNPGKSPNGYTWRNPQWLQPWEIPQWLHMKNPPNGYNPGKSPSGYTWRNPQWPHPGKSPKGWGINLEVIGNQVTCPSEAWLSLTGHCFYWNFTEERHFGHPLYLEHISALWMDRPPAIEQRPLQARPQNHSDPSLPSVYLQGRHW